MEELSFSRCLFHSLYILCNYPVKWPVKTENANFESKIKILKKIKSISKTAYMAVDSAGVWVKGKRLTKTLDNFQMYQGNRSYFFNKKGQIVKEVY